MKEEEGNSFLAGELLPNHELINKIKNILEKACEKLSVLSSETLDHDLSKLGDDNKLPSILKLSCYIEYWAINYKKEKEKQSIQTGPSSTRETLNLSQAEEIEDDELDRRSKEQLAFSKYLERIAIKNEILHKLFQPDAIEKVLSVAAENSTDTLPQEPSTDTASDHLTSLETNEKRHSGSSSNSSTQPTSASTSKSPNSTPNRKLHPPTPGIIMFRCPVGSRPRNTSTWYRFSDCVSINPNPLYPVHPSTPIPSLGGRHVIARCSTSKDIRVSLSASDPWGVVQRVSPTELVYPDFELQGQYSIEDLKHRLPLPLPVTLEELFHGVTKTVTFSKFETNRQNQVLRRKVQLDVNVKAGMYAGKKIDISPGHGWPIRRLSFVIYEIEHPVFSRQFDKPDLQVSCKHIGDRSDPKSIHVTFIDGEQKLIHLNDFEYRVVGKVSVEKKGMPKNAVKNGPRGGLNIAPRRRFNWMDLWGGFNGSI